MGELLPENGVIARYHPVGGVLAPCLLILAFGLFMAWPYLHPGGVEGFIAEYRKGFAVWIISTALGPLGIGMGILLAYRMITQRGVAVRYEGATLHFTQPLMVAIPADEIMSVEPSKSGVRNLILKLAGGRTKRIYGSFYDRSTFEVARDIHARLGLAAPEQVEDPDPLEVIKARRERERDERATRR